MRVPAKKIKILTLAALAGVFLLAAQLPAQAVAFDPCTDYGFCPVAGDGGTAGANDFKDEFSLGETPYVRLTVPGTALDFTISLFKDPNDDFFTGSETNSLPGGDGTIYKWYTLLDDFDWSAGSVVGDWTAQATFYDRGLGGWQNKETSFTVTPEPVQVVLFLLGGAPIAASLYRKSRFRKA